MLYIFLGKSCQFCPDYKITKTAFYNAYLQWAQSQGHSPMPINEIGRQMKQLKLVGEGRTKNVRFWRGIRLRAPDEEVEEKNIAISTIIEEIDDLRANASRVNASPTVETELKSEPIHNKASVTSRHKDILDEKLRQDLVGTWQIQRF